MKIRNLFVCAALAFAPGCSKSPDAMMDKMMDMMDELGNAIEGANGDCAKMADSVSAVEKKYEGDLKAMKEMGEKMKGDKAKAEELQKKYGPRMEKAMPKLMGMMKCADDPKMKEVEEKLKGMM